MNIICKLFGHKSSKITVHTDRTIEVCHRCKKGFDEVNCYIIKNKSKLTVDK